MTTENEDSWNNIRVRHWIAKWAKLLIEESCVPNRFIVYFCHIENPRDFQSFLRNFNFWEFSNSYFGYQSQPGGLLFILYIKINFENDHVQKFILIL